MPRAIAVLPLLAALSPAAAAQPTILGPDHRDVPGAHTAETEIHYRNPAATNVAIAGSWDRWKAETPLTPVEGVHRVRLADLDIAFGRYEYKFILDGEYEPGNNRVLYVNTSGALEPPPDAIQGATLETLTRVDAQLSDKVSITPRTRFRFEPPLKIERVEIQQTPAQARNRGYVIRGDQVTFVFDPAAYGTGVTDRAGVFVAGNFNGWSPQASGNDWRLRRNVTGSIWTLTKPLSAFRKPADEPHLLFKYTLGTDGWLTPPDDASNLIVDAKGNRNLRLDRNTGGERTVRLHLAAPFDVTRNHTLFAEYLLDTPAWRMVTPGSGLMETWQSPKELGAILDRENNATHYRLFAPRARAVHLNLYDDPAYMEGPKKDRTPVQPDARYTLWRDPADNVWEVSRLGLDIGTYYAFTVEGPDGDGEAFDSETPIGDPYGRAAANADNCTIVLDPHATNQWFGGWTDQDWTTPNIEDLVIYEAHVRDLTMHPSSGVNTAGRGRFQGILDSVGTGAGLDHLKAMGINAIEFLPMQEFNNQTNRHDWGYATAYFFAPEASYGRSGITGSQYYEFKHLVNELHREGFAVIIDVVYNHVGYPNVFQAIDRKYYFRLNPDYTYSNFSGVGNDTRSESPMFGRLIIDNVLYWMTEFHVDGFRFDLCELIDIETMMRLRDAARAINPEVYLISEPWSFRGTHKHLLTGTKWSAWNDDFRNAAKHFGMGDRNRDNLRKVIFGSLGLWAEDPRQPVNYLESHDDMALADEISTVPGRDAIQLSPIDADSNRLVASILFTSLGTPMIAEGQEFLRSKRGIANTYNRGDDINALNWDDRDRMLAREAMEYYRDLIALRRSEPGRSFRPAKRPPAHYMRWIAPASKQALGYIVNAPQIHPGAGFVVLLNGGSQAVPFRFHLPVGAWRQIGDGKAIAMDGVPDGRILPGNQPATITVPGSTAFIFMDGF